MIRIRFSVTLFAGPFPSVSSDFPWLWRSEKKIAVKVRNSAQLHATPRNMFPFLPRKFIFWEWPKIRIDWVQIFKCAIVASFWYFFLDKMFCERTSGYRRSQYYRSTSLHKYVVKFFSGSFLEHNKLCFGIKSTFFL